MWVLHSTQPGLSRLGAGNFAEIQEYRCGGEKSATPGRKTLEKPMCRMSSPPPGNNEAAFLNSLQLLPKTLASHGFGMIPPPSYACPHRCAEAAQLIAP